MRNTADLTQSAFWPAIAAPPTRGLRQWVDLGTMRLPREDIIGCRLEDIVEHDRAGRIATLGLFVAAGIVLTLGLVDLDWRTRTMLGTGVLAIVGIVSGMEALGITRTVHYRLDILLNDGRRIAYTTADRRDAEDLADELGPIPPDHHDSAE